MPHIYPSRTKYTVLKKHLLKLAEMWILIHCLKCQNRKTTTNDSDLYLRGMQFKSWFRHQLPQMRLFVVLEIFGLRSWQISVSNIKIPSWSLCEFCINFQSDSHFWNVILKIDYKYISINLRQNIHLSNCGNL